MAKTEKKEPPSQRIKQPRGRKTYDALIETGFALLEHKELEAISIAELTKAAGYSVGAFYARFRSKDEFFDAMIARHLEDRARDRDRLMATAPDDRLVNVLIEDLVTYYWKRRRFWRAALVRSIRDTGFWTPIRQHGRGYADLLVDRINKRAKRPILEIERTNVSFAFQLALGIINNAILNRPGPIFIEQDLFIQNLARAFRLVCDFDQLMGIPAPKASRRKTHRPEPRPAA